MSVATPPTASPATPAESLPRMRSAKAISSTPMFRYLLVLTFAQAAAFLGWTALYTNFAVEVVGLNGSQNGIVQAVREIPGLLSLGVVGLLLIMNEVTLTSLAILVCGLGVIITGWFPVFEWQIFWTLVLSFGFHYFEATNQSLTLQYFSKTEAPLVISRLRAVTASGSFMMGIIILTLSNFLEYKWLFGIAGSFAVIAAFWAFTQKPRDKSLPTQRKGIVIRSRYWLFYVLTALSGARRQIFSVFSIFLMVSHFHFSLTQMSFFLLFSNLVNWVLNPLIGKAINAFGEKPLLTGKYIAVILLCVGYIVCDVAWVAALLYVIDQLLFGFTISIRTFFQKIADQEDIAPSMALGVTINHIAAVAVPFVGGMLWMIDYRIPFAMGIGMGCLSLLMVQFIPSKNVQAA